MLQNHGFHVAHPNAACRHVPTLCYIEAWQTDGMSQAAYCREHGLNTKTLGNWMRKHRAGQVIRSPALVPVTIKPLPVPTNTLRLRGRGDHVLELPSMVSPHWLGELLK